MNDTMPNQPMNSMPNPAGNTPRATGPGGYPLQNGQKKVGPIIAILVIVLVLVIAALYLFASHVNQQAASTPTPTNATQNGSSVMYDQSQAPAQTVQPVTSNATDPQSLDSDLNNSTNGLDNQNF